MNTDILQRLEALELKASELIVGLRELKAQVSSANDLPTYLTRDSPIEELALDLRELHWLKRAGFRTVGDIITTRASDAQDRFSRVYIYSTARGTVIAGLAKLGLGFGSEVLPDKIPVRKSRVGLAVFDFTIRGQRISSRTFCCLQLAGFARIVEIATETERDLLRIRNFGQASLQEVSAVLVMHGLRFGMTDRELLPEEFAEPNFDAAAFLNSHIEELGLNIRCYHVLKNANIRSARELVAKTEKEMLHVKGFGRKSLHDVKDILREHGLHFGMKL